MKQENVDDTRYRLYKQQLKIYKLRFHSILTTATIALKNSFTKSAQKCTERNKFSKKLDCQCRMNLCSMYKGIYID